METSKAKKRIVILGGGFGGVATARQLERLLRRRLRLLIDWTLALHYRPDSVRIGLDRETSWRLYEEAATDAIK